MTSNYGKYKKSLSEKDILIVESVAKESMLELGYQLDTDGNWTWTPRLTGIQMRLKRQISKWKHKELLNKKMKDLHDKFALINSFKSQFK